MINDCYNFKEICEKYGWNTKTNGIQDQQTYAKRRGVIIDPSFKKGCTYFKILQDNTVKDGEIWKPYPKQPNIEVSNLGRVRNIITNNYLGTLNDNGYVIFDYNGKKYQVHRVVMETFNPTEDEENKVVDHIDGSRSNNVLENLQWVNHKENMELCSANRQNINFLINNMIQRFGYQKTTQALLTLSTLLEL